MKKISWGEDPKRDLKVEYTRTCVENVVHCKVHSNTKKRKNVEARAIVAKILRGNGMPLEEIGFYLSRHHTTIIHLLSLADDLICTDNNFKAKYVVSKNLANMGEQIDYTEEDTISYKEQISNLKAVIEDLNLERSYNIKSNYKYNRIGSIIELIEDNTPEGHEKIIEEQIINLFRRIAYRNKL